MKFFFLLPMIFNSVFLISQSFTQIQFDDFNPNWVKYTNSLNKLDVLSYRLKDCFILNKNLYSLHNIIKDGYEGHVIDKIDLITGKQKWANIYYSTKVGEREYATSIFSNPHDDILLYSVRNRDSGRFWDIGFVEQRLIDSENGLVTDSIIRNGGVISQIPNGLNPKIISLSSIDQNINYFSLELGFSIFYRYVSRILTPEGELDKITSFQTIVNDESYRYISMDVYHLSDKSKYLLRHQESIDKSQFTLDLVHVSEQLDSLNSFDISVFVDDAEKFDIVDASSEFVLIKSSKKKYNDVYIYDVINYYLFDSKGNLLDKAKLENVEGNDKFDGGTAVKVLNESKIFCVYSNEIDEYQTLIFAKSNGAGRFDIVKELKSNTKNDIFQCKKILFVDSDLLINLSHSDRTFTNPYSEKSVWISFSKGDLSLTSKNINTQNTIDIFPNPTNGMIQVNNNLINIPKKIIVYDVVGVKKLEIKFANKINLNSLSNGTYLIEFLDEQGKQLWSQKVILHH